MKEEDKIKDFSFLKLRDEIINKSGIIPSSNELSSPINQRLKFEPNINITRSHSR
jgi:hypothetical protein